MQSLDGSKGQIKYPARAECLHSSDFEDNQIMRSCVHPMSEVLN